jgi:hypothetical protein
MNEKKVYIVGTVAYEGVSIAKVFSTQEKADAFIAKPEHRYREYKIGVYRLDAEDFTAEDEAGEFVYT